jgi:CRISPR-associated Csx2 family protein
MPLKLLTFLGTSSYKLASYYFDKVESTSAQVHYVQETLIRKYAPASIVVFVTQEALSTNYENRIVNRNEYEVGQGLQSRLAKLQQDGYSFDFRHELIEKGSDSDQLWKVFDNVFQSIEKDDEIIFDITHGLRSLPMLAMVLISYARTLKKIKIKAICYGAYEAGEQVEDVYLAPIFDLTPFVELQDWTYAAQSFVIAGDAESLSALTARTFPLFSKSIKELTQSIKTCRGKFIVDEFDAHKLKNEIKRIKQGDKSPRQLSPLLNEVEEKIKPFNNNTIKNGFAAVEWCIQHDLIQQGITILQEVLISLVIEGAIDEEEKNNRVMRELASAALNGKELRENDYRNLCTPRSKLRKEDIDDDLDQMVQWVTKFSGLKNLYTTLTGTTGFRNDINHAGFRDTALKPDQLRQELQQLYQKIKALDLPQ